MDGAGEGVARDEDAAEEVFDDAATLEGAQAGGVRGGDVDDEDVGVGAEGLDAVDKVVDRVRVRGLVLAEVDREDLVRVERAREADGVGDRGGGTGGGGEECADDVVVWG